MRQFGKMMLCAVASLLLPAGAQAKAVIVDRDQFQCLADKLQTVPSDPKGVYVDIRDCRKKGLKVVRHLFQPTPPANPDGVETLLYLKPSHIKCIRQNRRSIRRIAVPAGPGRLIVKLDPCGR